MADTKTREQIIAKIMNIPEFILREEYVSCLKNKNILAAMSEYSSHQNKELLERIKELEDAMTRLKVYPLNDEQKRIIEQLLNNKTDKPV